jgi:hypothetical protein
MQHAGFKNQGTIQTIFEDQSVEDILFQKTGGFSQKPRAKAFQTRNESSIPMLKSYRTLDFECKDEEYNLIET